MVTRTVSTLLLACFLNLLAGCQPQSSAAIRFGLASAPVNLDPRFATDAVSERINRLIYRSLVDFDDASRPQPALASWRLIEPGRYRFRLGNAGREFHDGTRLDASDVVATYRSILDPDTASPHRKILSLIKTVQVIDEDTIEFILRRHDVLLPAYLGIGIMPEEAIAAGHALSKKPVGSGPFKFGHWPHAGQLHLLRVRDDQPLVFEKVADPTMRVLKLLRGEIDLLQNDLPAELVTYLSKQQRVKVQRMAGSNFTYLGLNLKNEHTALLAVRKAIALSIDREAIIRYIFADRARLASSLLPPSHWAGGKNLVSKGRDIPAARKLLAAAGYTAQQPLQLEYKTSSDPFRIRIATILQQQLAEAGIKVTIKSYDWGTFYGDIKAGRFQLFSLAWVGVKTPDIFRYVFHSHSLPPDGANRGRLQDRLLDKLIAEAENATDMQQKARLYRQIQAYLLEILPYIPLWYEDQFAAMRVNIQHYKIAADGNFDALTETVKSLATTAGSQQH